MCNISPFVPRIYYSAWHIVNITEGKKEKERDLEGFSMRIERLQKTAALLESGQGPERWVVARAIKGGAGRGTL